MLLPWERRPRDPPTDEEDKDDSEDEELDRPPPEYLTHARMILPSVSVRTLMASWDKTRGIRGGAEGGYDLGSARVQAALNHIFDDPAPDLSAPSSPAKAPVQPVAAAAAAEAPPLPIPKRAVLIDLGDSDSDAPAPPLPLPKARMRKKAPHNPRAEVIDLATSSDSEGAPRAGPAPRQTFTLDDTPPPAGPAPRATLSELPPDPEASPEDAALASVLSIIPDVLPLHVLGLLRHSLYNGKVDIVLDHLLTKGDYPKVEVEGKGKGKKRARSEEEVVEKERDFLEVGGRQGMGSAYEEAALLHLCEEYNTVSKNDIKRFFHAQSSFYAPAFMAIKEALESPEKKHGIKIIGARAKGKGKGKEVVCIELEKERTWLRRKLAREKREKEEKESLARREQEEIERGEFFECGCCFGECGFSQLATCTEGCQFCFECAAANANNQIGMRKFILPCMSTDGCKAVFPESEAVKFLPSTTLAALHKIRQEKEVDLAEIDGLAKCPFCPFAMIIENKDERLLVCQRDECGIVSCLQCKKEDHLPRTCAEMDTDKKIDGMHIVEEAMTEALIRKCPKCSEPYVKDDGCNKISCPSCRTISCYICMKIVAGYEHFSNAGTNATYTDPGASCALWDDTKTRNFKEVEAAREAAAATVAQQNPAVVAEDLKALHLLPPPPPAAHLVPVINALHRHAPQLAAPPAPHPAPYRGHPAGPRYYAYAAHRHPAYNPPPPNDYDNALAQAAIQQVHAEVRMKAARQNADRVVADGVAQAQRMAQARAAAEEDRRAAAVERERARALQQARISQARLDEVKRKKQKEEEKAAKRERLKKAAT